MPARYRVLNASHLASVLPPMILVALAVATYYNALTNPFVFDDRTEIVENRSIVDLSNPRAIVRASPTRPLVNLSYALDYAAGGLTPFVYHRTNLFLHVLVVLLLAQVGRRAMEDWREREPGRHPDMPSAATVGFWAAALFAVHPLLTEAVGYVSGRSELLSGVFGLTAFLLLRRAARAPSFGRSAAAVGAIVLALASKELAVMLPVAFLVYDRLLLDRTPAAVRRRWLFVHLPLLGLMALGGVARLALYLLVEHPTAPRFAWVNTLILPGVFSRYLSMLIVPADQSIVQQVFPVGSIWARSFLVPALALSGLAAAAWFMRRSHPVLAFCSTWFVLFLLPSAALVLFDRGQPMAEHRVYMASCGFFVAVAYGLARVPLPAAPAWPPARTGVVAALVAALSILTIVRNQVWADPVRLWADAAAKAPNTWAAQYGLATALREQGDCERAVTPYQRAATLLPSRVDAFYGLAICLTETGRLDDARHALLAAVALNPRSPDALLSLADFYERVQRNPAEALRLCTEAKALGADPRLADGCIARNEQGTVPPLGRLTTATPP